MPSVSEQLQKYRLLNGDNAHKKVPDTSCTIQWQHPNTQDYFRDLMQQWRKNNSRGRLVNAAE